ncbi:MAG: thymidylate synthase [Thermofilaceae archaeon]
MVAKDVAFFNEESNVAVVTLWTKKEVVVGRLAEAGLLGRVHAVGTLYTVYGINYLLHTLAERPQINVLIVYGSDLSGSGEALVRLFGEKSVPPDLELMWPLEVVEPIVRDVDVVDLREACRKGEWIKLEEAINGHYRPGKRRRATIRLQLRESRVEGWPLPISGLLIQEGSLFRAWLKAVYVVMALGSVKWSEYGEHQKQLLNLVVTLGFYGRPLLLEPRMLNYFPKEEFEKHYRLLLEPVKPEGVNYTYGERLRFHPIAGDQLEELVAKLRSSSHTRRALAVLWHHARDCSSTDPPCIVLIQGDVTGGFYNHSVYLRSNDMYAAWPLNAYAQAKLAELIASELGAKVGAVTLISCSAHVYEHDWERAWRLIHDNLDTLSEFTPDPRGNVLLYPEGGNLEVEHRTPLGQLSSRLRVGSYRQLKPLAILLSSDHAFYLGWEARRALERAARGEPYRQDEDDL